MTRRWQLDEAIDDYQAAIKSNPGLEKAYYNLETVWAQKGQEEAIRYLSNALVLDPNYAEAHNNIGVVLIRQGKISEEAAHFQKAVNLKANCVAAQKTCKKSEWI